MPGSKSDYLEAAILDLVLGGVAFTPPANVFIALSTAAYSDAATGAAMTEVGPGLGYVRVEVANTLTEWPAASGTNPATKSNAHDIVFPTATGDWGNCQSAYICDAATNGSVLYGGPLGAPADVGVGSALTIDAGTLIVTED